MQYAFVALHPRNLVFTAIMANYVIYMFYKCSLILGTSNRKYKHSEKDCVAEVTRFYLCMVAFAVGHTV